MVKGISVVIPSRNVSLLSRAINSIVRTHASLHETEIIVIDDGLDKRPDFRAELKYVPGVSPFCFAVNINLGIRNASGSRDIFVMNDDTFFVTRDGLRVLQTSFSDRERLGLVSPVFTRPERTASQRLGHLEPDAGVCIERNRYLTFAGVLLRREMINIVGYLDETFTGYGYDDTDYSLRARLGGYELGVQPGVVMGHGDGEGRASLSYRDRDDMNQLLMRNRRVFLFKWGKSLLGLDEDGCEKLIRLISFM